MNGVWIHAGCGGRVFFEESGGICAECEAAGLDSDDYDPLDGET